MNAQILTKSGVQFFRFTAPLMPDTAWEIEALLLKIFQYFNYPLRSVLLGKSSGLLVCTCFTAWYENKIIAAAVCLYSRRNPAVALLAPVGVAVKYRRRGIATELVKRAKEYLERKNVCSVYLALNDDNIASNLYGKLGFQRYKGIVWRKMFCPRDEFEKNYFGKSHYIKIRRAGWEDFAGISALASCPAQMYAFDTAENILSSRYAEPENFLAVFPGMMSHFRKWGGMANVLEAGKPGNIVGIAQIKRPPAKARRHLAECDFFLTDNFIDNAELLVNTTLIHSFFLSVDKFVFYALACDKVKRKILTGLGAQKIAVIPDYIKIRNTLQDLIIYQLVRGNNENL